MSARVHGARGGGRGRGWRLLAVLLGMDLVATAAFVAWAQQCSPPPPRTGHWPVAVVFFADFDTSLRPGPHSRARVARALDLYRTGLVDHLACVGGLRAGASRRRMDSPEDPGDPPTGAVQMCESLRNAGVPATALAVGGGSLDTRSNWVEARALLAKRGWQRALLVSSPLHLPRIIYLRPAAMEVRPVATASALRQLLDAPFSTWALVHREWLAWTAELLLPDAVHARWILRWRQFWG